MEAINEDVSESRSSRRKRFNQSRTSLAESPPSQNPRGVPRKRKREKETTSEQYWELRDIIDEKVERGEIKYLIDWKDNRDTGEKYKPTWVRCLVLRISVLLEWNC